MTNYWGQLLSMYTHLYEICAMENTRETENARTETAYSTYVRQ